MLGVPESALLVEVEFEITEIRQLGETHEVRTDRFVEAADVGKCRVTRQSDILGTELGRSERTDGSQNSQPAKCKC